ncbi:SulP family inorganic anion transporter [Novosphingobium mangrovi (ex Huang et al. 2023)]|uniref:SulP family inorganic anion transporter n=1 Tax=Novosphingobium mangrovi (ex Huang et al. 2023) TaxID=2976432 RepID=A0ABT2I9Z2_9SPHN|nr:SulP family inorganic anion transporter [Novosphingobium mangrovi (ex Huang et al. 2023)]MCT2401322.1 SulP family inorganic anion transporter [Novosphingobium mangrovi (ex Huang et al. 2023)]
MKPKLLTTLPTYTGRLFAADLFAGITVAMVAIPLSIAIAIASGADPAAGLFTAIVAGFVISLLGGSRVQIGGPTGAFIVVVYGVIAQHGYDGLVLATLMAGMILLIAGLLRVGNLITFVPEAVVNGFTIGIAVIIASGQLKDFFGLQAEHVPAEFIGKIQALWAARGTIDWATTAAGASTLALLVIMRRLFPRIPGPIFVLGGVSLVLALTHQSVDTIFSRYGELPNHLPVPALPHITLARVTELLPSAMVIAFLAAIESLLSAMVADRMLEGAKHRPNAEVLAQGWASIASSLFGGLPATGAIARTATNVRAGGRTPIAGIVHAATILIVLMVAAPLAGYLAMPALAALLIITAWNMSEPHKWPHYWSAPLEDRALLLLTLVLTVLADLTVAIGVGVALGLALRLRDSKLKAPEWETPER